ncbi:hypothetical protein BDN71DRAFT_1528882 [Pleurotus eryngii]|uniref:Uncharacterized protein n=1 Tax=Pleurotus eryngii TaxID=5323 RepID=A0A9P6DI65_PLEER|nr:hypothetical protein BDN71DRAFT_1528882 [Pleurotus eryngii]
MLPPAPPVVTLSLPSPLGFLPATLTPSQMQIMSEVMIDHLGQNLCAKHRKEAAIQARQAKKAHKQAAHHSTYAELIHTTPSTPMSARTIPSPPIASGSTLPPLSPEEELAMYTAITIAPTNMLINIDDTELQASEPST